MADDRDIYTELTKPYESYMKLSEIVEYIPNVTLTQLNRWSEDGRNIGFPEPKERLGRFKLYDRDEVLKWVFLWQKATRGAGRPTNLTHNKKTKTEEK